VGVGRRRISVLGTTKLGVIDPKEPYLPETSNITVDISRDSFICRPNELGFGRSIQYLETYRSEEAASI
jgi:hypothetical protein